MSSTRIDASSVYLIALLLVCIIIAIISIIEIFSAVSMRYAIKHKKEIMDSDKKFFKKLFAERNLITESLEAYKTGLKLFGIDQTIHCSSSVVTNAINDINKYILKYTNLNNDQRSLRALDFFCVFQKKHALFISDMNKANQIIREQLPLFFRIFIKKKKLPYTVCGIDYSLSEVKIPCLRFLYVSPAGRSSRECSIDFTVKNIENLESEISKNISEKDHKKIQRAAMTSDLREAIKKRDDYTCQKCGNSVYKEPNLLLEVDHIVPIAKGGKTEADNLQTLCWRCNRLKGTKSGRKRKK